MRWKGKIPQLGDKRIISRFLFLPNCLDGEWRWLEFANIEQEFVERNMTSPGLSHPGGPSTVDVLYWESQHWREPCCTIKQIIDENLWPHPNNKE